MYLGVREEAARQSDDPVVHLSMAIGVSAATWPCPSWIKPIVR